MGTPTRVLDHGFVAYVDHMGSDLSVANAARVSFGKRKDTFDEADAKLIRYLAENEHTSPFRHTAVTLHMKAPLVVKAQVDKHQVGVAINTVSGRYVQTAEEYHVPDVFRAQPANVKQGSAGEIHDPLGIAPDLYEDACDHALTAYKALLAMGVCKEQARLVLPQGMYTEWWMTASVQAWAHFIRLRTDSHSQLETQVLARAARSIVEPLFPASLAALLA